MWDGDLPHKPAGLVCLLQRLLSLRDTATHSALPAPAPFPVTGACAPVSGARMSDLLYPKTAALHRVAGTTPTPVLTRGSARFYGWALLSCVPLDSAQQLLVVICPVLSLVFEKRIEAPYPTVLEVLSSSSQLQILLISMTAISWAHTLSFV